MIIFLIYLEFGAMRKPDSEYRVCKTYIFINLIIINLIIISFINFIILQKLETELKNL